MARRSKTRDPEALRRKLIGLLSRFEDHLKSDGLREQVRALIPVNHTLRDLGCSLLQDDTTHSARQRILAYLRRFAGQIVDGDELMVVAGISEYARRIRELRVQEGWPILSGATVKQLRDRDPDEAGPVPEDIPPEMKPDQYLLQQDAPDRDAAYRWHIANGIRKKKGAVQDKLLEYFRKNVGQRITSEELRYVAGNRSEWARRTRELRTEEGWPIVTCFNGDPSLPVGVYVLVRDVQGPAHDRHIKEIVRREVLQRDGHRCRWAGCGWSQADYDKDPRYLEVHHIRHHAAGGSNDGDNLVTLCNLHHDMVHGGESLDITSLSE
ncbi:HNH endonuclease signature motif containing protein [Oleispirillum naphthae]|uniref:HNH endonuclease n=1 Tax=Oleispirillum naphthae TaxID=2838853 RepID=UPI0030826585